MRIARSTLIGTAVAMALFGRNGLVQAQQQGADQLPPTGEPLQEVVVTGIRASLQQSIQLKKDADTFIDVVTADDIGKMPDKNVADALMRIPGVTVSSAGANEGGFDEQDRVSMRGTNPSLTQTLINGHSVASADWFVLNQTGTVGRSVSYTLLPSELVQQVVVEKSSQASLVEGGVAGSVNIITRKALDFHQNELQFSAGGVYADLPAKWAPQFSGLGAWVNDSHNFGVMVQLFSETRYLRRDGQEILGYGTIQSGSAIALAHPDLAGVQYPALIGSALFQQKRERNGGMLDVEFQPSDSLTIDATGFLSKLQATNLNDNYLMWLQNGFVHDGAGQSPNPGYVVQNNTLVSAAFAPVTGTPYGVYDQISRPNEVAETNFGNLDMEWRATDKLKFYAQGGVSTAHGKTPFQDVLETNGGVGAGAAYTLNGTTTAPNWNLGSFNNTTPNPINPTTGLATPVPFGWIFGDQNMDVLDKEWWTRLDGSYSFNAGIFKDLQFGARYAEHQRHLWNVIGQGPNFGALGPDPSQTYPTGYQNYPSNYGNGLGSGFPTQIWYFSPDQLSAYDSAYANRDPVSRADWTADYGLKEKDPSAYLEATFSGDNWAGNLGVRYVQTKEEIINNVGVAADYPGAITTSAFGPYIQVPTDHTYNDVLPTANFKLNLKPDLILRAAAGETMTRADYSALAGSIQLGAPPPPCTPTECIVGSGSGSNPNLKPITSWNYDLGMEWYFAPRSLLDVDVFYMDLKNYVGFGTVRQNLLTFGPLGPPQGYEAPYDLTVPVNATGRVGGAEFNYIQAIGEHWGIETNYTYADGKQTSLVTNGDDRLVGTSKNTFNLMGYYENAHFSARIAYNYRSEFFSGLDRNTAFSQNGLGTLAASLVWIVNDNFSVTVDGMNLNNPTLKYFAQNDSQPRAFYKNGSQYYLTLRFKM